MLPTASQLPAFGMMSVSPQGGLPGYRMYPCADGGWVHLACPSGAGDGPGVLCRARWMAY
jgi:hypothetical protein